MKRNGTVARATDERELLVATLCRSTPQELLDVATKLQKRSSDHAAVLHDSLYLAATQRRAPKARQTRAVRRVRRAVPSLKAALRVPVAARAGRRRG